MRSKFKILKPFKLYRDLTVIFDTKRKMFENSVLVFTDTQDRTYDIVNSRLFETQHIRCFYMDKFLDKPTFRRLIPTGRVDIYDAMKSHTGITLTPLNTGVLKAKNTWYPAWAELQQMFNIPGAKNKVAFMSHMATVNALLMRRGNADLYKHKYVVLDARLFGKDFGNSESANIRGLCIGSLLYLQIKRAITEQKPELWPFAGRDTILFEPSSGVSFPIPSDISTLTLSKFRWMLKILYKLNTGASLTEEDLAEESATDAELKPQLSASARGYVVSDSRSAALKVDANTLVYATAGDAFTAFCRAQYPDASVEVGKKSITLTMDAGTPALAKALYEGKLGVYRSKSLVSTSRYTKVGDAFKAVQADTAELTERLTVKKSGDKLCGLTVTLEIGSDHPLIQKAKAAYTKKIEGMKSALPLTPEQKEILYSIDDRIEELTEAKSIDELKSIEKTFDEDPVMKSLANSLNASRLLEVQNKRAADLRATLDSKQSEATLLVNGKNLKLADKLKALESVALKPIEFNTQSLNPELNKSSMKALRDAYRQDMYEFDQYRIFTQFSSAKDIPIFVESIERKDTSTPFTMKETLSIKFNIAGERPKTMNIDVPKIDQDGYLYIQGARKQVTNQITLMPIVKLMQSGELVVQYNTSYNKIFLSRAGGNFNRRVASLIKAFSKLTESKQASGRNFKIVTGNALETNSGLPISLEYFELSKSLVTVKINDLTISFSSRVITDMQNSNDIDLAAYAESFPADKFFMIGTLGKLPVFAGMVEGVYVPSDTDGATEIAADIVDLIYKSSADIETISSALNTEIYTGRNFSYTKLEVSNVYIPLLVFLGFKDGLEEIFETYGIEYSFIPSGPSAKTYTVPEGIFEKVPFKDGTLYFKANSVSKNLLANGIFKLDTKSFNLQDFKADGEGYYQYFIDNATPRYGKALQNFYTLFIDPITKDILKDNDIPHDITGSFLYCNDLLQDASYHPRFDMSVYRIRNLECINALLYKLVARQVEKYRRGSRGDTAGTLAVRSDALFIEMQENANFEDSTLLNPIKDCDNIAKAVYKGPGAPGYGHAQGTEELRFFDGSQMGIYGMNTSFDGNAGMNRRLSMNTLITSKRGYVKANSNPSNMDATNLFSVGELTMAFTCRHSDPDRLMMGVAQGGHQIPVKHMNYPVVSTGVFKAIPYIVSNEFVFKAPEDGVVVGPDKKDKFIINVRYSDGTRGVIDTSTKYRRSPDGFFITINQKPALKAGQKFKKGEIIAYDENFFRDNGEGVEMMRGTLAKVAIVGRDITLEDSSCISESLADKMESAIVMETTLQLSPSTNLIDIVKIGQAVKASENLAVFEENLESTDVSSALDKMSASLQESLAGISRNAKTSKYTGTIVDMEVFYNHPIEEYSPSLQAFLKAYIAATQAKEENLKDVRSDEFIRHRDLNPQKTGRAKGAPFDGVLVNIYIKLEEGFNVGDKLSVHCGLKSVVGEVIPTKLAPTSEYYSERVVDVCISPFSILNRKVPDFMHALYCNKVIISLKKALKDMIA